MFHDDCIRPTDTILTPPPNLLPALVHRYASPRVVDFLIDAGFGGAVSGQCNPLLLAVQRRDFPGLQRLVEDARVDVSAVGKDGRGVPTACSQGFHKTCKLVNVLRCHIVIYKRKHAP